MRWAGYVARTAKLRKYTQNLVGKPEGKRILGKSMNIWENNIWDLQESFCETVDCTGFM
jgi:hypothetical protein